MAGMLSTSPGARQQADASALAEWKRQDAANTHAQQQISDAQRLGYSAAGPGAYGSQWSVQSRPVDRMAGGSAGVQRVNMADVSRRAAANRANQISMSQAMSQMQPATPPPAPGRQAPISMMDRSAGEAAAFGRAKDQVGEEARGAADSLSDEMSARGLSGSGIEGAQLGKVIQTGQGQLGDVNRTQAIDHMQRADQVQDENYQGGISQRGQDFEGRAQDINAQQSRQSNAMRLMQLLQQRVI